MLSLRWYQKAAVEAVYAYLRQHDDNPVIVLPVGAGKSLVIAQIARDAVQLWQGRVLIVTHVQELVTQNAEKIRRMCPHLAVGIHSAGLKRRDTENSIICAGIQSIYKRASDLGRFDLVLIDECHLLPREGEGMYRQFLREARAICPHQRVIGLTATPFRLDSGMICSDDHFLNAICYEVGIKELIRDGYLSRLITKGGRSKADTTQLHVRAGEFVGSEAEKLMNEQALVSAACDEIVQRSADRNAVLIFAAGIGHARHIQCILETSHQQECGLVVGSTPNAEREELLARFCGKPGTTLFAKPPLKFLVNYGVLTTGFDNPRLDVIAILRPTMSPGLLVQMIGRGTRLCPGKRDCLILDFAGNILRHGPIDQITGKEKRPAAGGLAPVKECPECHSFVATGYAKCPDCGYTFPPPEPSKHEPAATRAGVVSGQVTETRFDVMETYYSVHTKRNSEPDAPRTMRVDYKVGYHLYKSEWVCFEHSGYARAKAVAWWRRRSPDPVPDTIEEAVSVAEGGGLARTKAITVRAVAGDPYERIVDVELGEMPEPLPAASSSTMSLDDIPF